MLFHCYGGPGTFAGGSTPSADALEPIATSRRPADDPLMVIGSCLNVFYGEVARFVRPLLRSITHLKAK